MTGDRQTVDDLPSAGPELVTSSVFGSPFSVENWSAVQSER